MRRPVAAALPEILDLLVRQVELPLEPIDEVPPEPVLHVALHLLHRRPLGAQVVLDQDAQQLALAFVELAVPALRGQLVEVVEFHHHQPRAALVAQQQRTRLVVLVVEARELARAADRVGERAVLLQPLAGVERGLDAPAQARLQPHRLPVVVGGALEVRDEPHLVRHRDVLLRRLRPEPVEDATVDLVGTVDLGLLDQDRLDLADAVLRIGQERAAAPQPVLAALVDLLEDAVDLGAADEMQPRAVDQPLALLLGQLQLEEVA